MSPLRVHRRGFLLGAGSTVVALAGWGVLALRADNGVISLTQRLRELFDEPAVLKLVAARVASDVDWTVEVVSAELAAVVGWSMEAVDATGAKRVEPPREQLVRSLAEAASRDFLDGDTVVVDGWLLSRTELRLVTLAGLDPTF